MAVLGKVGIAGAGRVGQACALALLLRGSARQIVLVDREPERATGVATDLRYAVPLVPTVDITAGSWGDLARADGGPICAGGQRKSRRRRRPDLRGSQREVRRRDRPRTAEAARDERRGLP